MVKDKVVEAEWKYLDVNEHWQQMKHIMMETSQDICELSLSLLKVKVHADKRKHGGGMRKLLKQQGN